MLSRSLALLALAASSLAIDINGPSSAAYWVQNATNVITWTFTSEDPNPIDIIVTHANMSILNGDFSIQRDVDLTNGTFTVSQVTLRVASGYQVEFVNGSNPEQVYATSAEFEVRPPGTPTSDDVAAQASNTTPASSDDSSDSEEAGGDEGASDSDDASSPSVTPNAGNQVEAMVFLPMMATTGILALAGLALLL